MVCPARSRGGCGGVQITAEPLETHVTKVLLAELRRPGFLAEMAGDDHGRRDELNASLEAVEARRAELAGLWASGGLGSKDWTAAGRQLDVTESNLRTELKKVPTPLDIDPQMVAQGWEAMKLGERRAVVAMFVESVTVNRATHRGPGLDEGRIRIAWK
jgi:hypothetical protein